MKGLGFVEAGELQAGDMVVTAKGETYPIERRYVEVVDREEMVYNFQVEDFRTYHVGDSGILVHNVCGGGSGSSVEVDLKYKEGWTAAQKAEAEVKVKALTEANTVKTPSTRRGTSASSRYKSAYGKNSVPQGYDVDHTIDLQLGGADDILNMNPLDLSVNRSLRVQIKNAIKDYDVGTVFDKFIIH